MKSRWLLRVAVLLLALGAGFAAEAPDGSGAQGVPSPRLAVIVVVDGAPWERLAAARPAFVSGLKRLLDEGLVERACRYRHLNTETGPGHASLSTGSPPRVNGIVANDWFEKGPAGKLRRAYCADQPPESGKAVVKGPSRLVVPTLGDRLVEQRPGARVVSLSGKDRAAILLAGRRPGHVVYWLDAASGRFITSPAYDAASPAVARAASIVAEFNAGRGGAKLAERYGTVWKKLDGAGLPPDLPPPAKEADIAPYQVPDVGLGFDHDLSKAPAGFQRGFFTSPFADEVLTDLALEVLTDPELALGRGAAPDLLCVSYSANDYVSHAYGPESAESLDILRHLDVQIGRLLDALDRQIGKAHVALALSADHGMSPIPEVERQRDRSFKGRRLLARETAGTLTTFQDWLNLLLDRELCLEPSARPVRGLSGWSAYYDRDGLPLRTAAGPCGPAGREVTARDLDRVLPGLVTRVFGEEIQEVLLTSREREWASGDPAVPYARGDFFSGRSGDAFLVPRDGVQLSWDPGRGTGHGSLHEPDIHVPLVFWGGGFAAGASDADTTPYDLAPTLAKILGVRLPEATGRALGP